ncbi:unnamed protein product, partial [Closterium sp. Naga37s-1]
MDRQPRHRSPHAASGLPNRAARSSAAASGGDGVFGETVSRGDGAARDADLTPARLAEMAERRQLAQLRELDDMALEEEGEDEGGHGRGRGRGWRMSMGALGGAVAESSLVESAEGEASERRAAAGTWRASGETVEGEGMGERDAEGRRATAGDSAGEGSGKALCGAGSDGRGGRKHGVMEQGEEGEEGTEEELDEGEVRGEEQMGEGSEDGEVEARGGEEGAADCVRCNEVGQGSGAVQRGMDEGERQGERGIRGARRQQQRQRRQAVRGEEGEGERMREGEEVVARGRDGAAQREEARGMGRGAREGAARGGVQVRGGEVGAAERAQVQQICAVEGEELEEEEEEEEGDVGEARRSASERRRRASWRGSGRGSSRGTHGGVQAGEGRGGEGGEGGGSGDGSAAQQQMVQTSWQGDEAGVWGGAEGGGGAGRGDGVGGGGAGGGRGGAMAVVVSAVERQQIERILAIQGEELEEEEMGEEDEAEEEEEERGRAAGGEARQHVLSSSDSDDPRGDGSALRMHGGLTFDPAITSLHTYLGGIVLFPEQTRVEAGCKEHMSGLEGPTSAKVHVHMDPHGFDIRVASVGTTAEIRRVRQQEDGSMSVVTRGRQRFLVCRAWMDPDGS